MVGGMKSFIILREYVDFFKSYSVRSMKYVQYWGIKLGGPPPQKKIILSPHPMVAFVSR